MSIDTLRGKDSAYYRMVVSYWDMAASFVNHGVIDEEMFDFIFRQWRIIGGGQR